MKEKSLVDRFKDQIYYGVLTILMCMFYLKNPVFLGLIFLVLFMFLFWLNTHGYKLFKRSK